MSPVPDPATGAGPEVVRVTSSLRIPVSELQFRFSPSGGPGGQHANASGSVVLDENCTGSTTTTSTTDGGSTTTTSTTEVSTTSTTDGGSTTFFSQGSTTVPTSITVAGETSTTIAPATLPFTGNNDGWAPLLGLSALGVGGALSLVSRRRGASKA